MKKFILAVLLATFAGLVHAQIPNGNFENWESFMGTGIRNPSKFFTSNISLYEGADTSVKRVPGVSGSAACLITHETEDNGQEIVNTGSLLSMSNFDLFSGEFNPYFPTNGRPLKMKGYYHYVPNGSDQFAITVSVFKNGVAIGHASLVDSVATNGFVPFSIEVAYDNSEVPDSALITAASSMGDMKTGTMLSVDEFTFEYAIGTSLKETPGMALNAFPVPSRDIVHVDTRSFEGSSFQVEVYDLSGRSCFRQRMEGQNANLQLDLAALKQGTYFLVVSDGNTTGRSRIILND